MSASDNLSPGQFPTVTPQDQHNIDTNNAEHALKMAVSMGSTSDWNKILKGHAHPPTTEQVQKLVSLRAAMSAETDPAAKNTARAAMRDATTALAESMTPQPGDHE